VIYGARNTDISALGSVRGRFTAPWMAVLASGGMARCFRINFAGVNCLLSFDGLSTLASSSDGWDFKVACASKCFPSFCTNFNLGCRFQDQSLKGVAA